ncbi:hypothetical protein, partial [Aeromonas caviae]|uniref:hypothetical protein n=1 Tax=Aeromonas caviae TaxID=648 RepID=UPI001CC72E76
MSFDAFAALAQPGASVTVHNVRLIDVQPDVMHGDRSAGLCERGEGIEAHARFAPAALWRAMRA